jgi:hypothetical protein
MTVVISNPAVYRCSAIGQQVTDLGDGERRDYQARPVTGEELRAPGMITVSFIPLPVGPRPNLYKF